MILNKAQAKAVYDAMCALNNVGGRIEASLPGGTKGNIVVREISGVGMQVRDGFRIDSSREDYPNQAAFAAAYGFGEPVAFN